MGSPGPSDPTWNRDVNFLPLHNNMLFSTEVEKSFSNSSFFQHLLSFNSLFSVLILPSYLVFFFLAQWHFSACCFEYWHNLTYFQWRPVHRCLINPQRLRAVPLWNWSVLEGSLVDLSSSFRTLSNPSDLSWGNNSQFALFSECYKHLEGKS